MGTYLKDHPPKSPQYRSPRRQTLIGVIGVHTTEGVLDGQGPDMGAENTASYISIRKDPGSYHDIVDSDSWVHVVDYGDEAFHIATHKLNRRTTGLSFACRTTDWAKMSAAKRAAFLRNGAKAAAAQARYVHAKTGIVIPARRLTLKEALAGQPGFLAHGDADPARRSDPGTKPHALFPWAEFFKYYTKEAADLLGGPTNQELTMDDEVRAEFKKLHEAIAKVGASVWSDEATDVEEADRERTRHGSLRGWVAAIAEKLGVSQADAMKHDPTHQNG